MKRREFLSRTGWSLGALAAWGPAAWGAEESEYDVVVIGGTPGGIATAVTAARLGRRVALVEYHRHFGGMSASGLGKSDIENKAAIAGLWAEFVTRVKQHYVAKFGADSENVGLCRDGYYYEPHVAEVVFTSFLDEQPGITRLPFHEFVATETRDGRVVAARVKNRKTGRERTLAGKVFVDATYEGDLYAAAGAEFRMGRESRDQYGEPHAGEIYLDWRDGQLLGGSGAGDKRLTTYTYRLCLTTDPQNAFWLTEPPAEYDRTRYLGYLDDFNSGRFGPSANLTRICLSIAAIPNRKTDVNMNPRGLGFVFVGENTGYVDGNWVAREKISARIRNLTLGLLWFLQNDEAVPAAARELARAHHLPLDEFADSGHFPFQLYVREARRLVGEYTLSERNITVQPGVESQLTHDDAIAVGEFPVDSFPMQKRQPGDERVLEGYLCMLKAITRPYQIPYRIMVPQKVDGLLAPVAASTTHVAFSSIRLEPTWMALGQAAGVAAHVAIQRNVQPRNVPIGEVQAILRKQNQVLDLPAAGNP